MEQPTCPEIGSRNPGPKSRRLQWLLLQADPAREALRLREAADLYLKGGV